MVRTRQSHTLLAAALAPLCFASTAGAALAGSGKTPDFNHVSCSGAANEVRVEINGLKQSVGLIVADLYREDDKGFLKRSGRVQQVRFAARAPTTKFCMRAPVSGKYAIAVYHDENAKKTLDRKAFGMPAEPYGISNNPVIRFGPPSLKESLFSLPDDGTHLAIELKH